MTDILYASDNFRSDGSLPNIGEQIKNVINKYHVAFEQLPQIIGLDKQIIEQLLNEKPCKLTKDQMRLLKYRLAFLVNGFSMMDPLERTRLIITDVLIEQFNFSYQSLAEYANVSVNALEQFLEGKNIESKDINNISVNLLMLNFVLNNRPK